MPNSNQKTPTTIKVVVGLMGLTISVGISLSVYFMGKTDKSHFRTIVTQEPEPKYSNEFVDEYDSIYSIQSKRFKR